MVSNNTFVGGNLRRGNDTMDLISEAQRLNEYYNELDQLVRQGVPLSLAKEIEADLCDPDADDQYRQTMSLWLHVYVPFYQVFSFIANNRILHEEMPLYLDEVSTNGIAYNADTIFRYLKSLIPSAANELIHTISGSDALHTQLHQALLSDQQSIFCQLVHDNGCDLHTVSYLCRHLMDDISTVLNLGDDQLDLVLDLSLKGAIAVLDDEYDDLSLAMREFDKALHQLRENDTDQNFMHYMKAFYDYLCVHLRYMIQSFWLHTHRYLSKERIVLEALLDREEALPVVHQAKTVMQQYQEAFLCEESSGLASTIANPLTGNGIGFKSRNNHFRLGDNYFTRDMNSANSSEYFYCHEEVLRGGPGKLTALINYLADHDYISKDIFIKSVFAYRLTGKGPSINTCVIQWNGRNGNPYELIYLVRYLTCRGDYKKMRRFFVGPRWVKDRDSSYAKSASYDFRKFLHELYPTICPL